MKNKNIKIGALIVFFSLIGFTASAQNKALKVGDNPTIKEPSAVLEVESANKGLLMPRVSLTGLTDVTTINAPANALTVFNTATTAVGTDDVTPGYYYWSSADSRWIRLNDSEDINIYKDNGTITPGDWREVIIPETSQLDFKAIAGAHFGVTTGGGEINLKTTEQNGYINIGTTGNIQSKINLTTVGRFSDITLSTKGDVQANVLLQPIAGDQNVGIGTPEPTEKLDVGTGNVRVRDITAAYTLLGTDKVVVATNAGVLKSVPTSALAIEPWRIQTTTNNAIANTDKIYQNNKVGVGDFSVTESTKQMEVKGDFKAEATSGGNRMGFEVNTPFGAQTTGSYWMSPTNQTHAFVVDPNSARAIAIDNLLAPTKASNFEVGVNAVNIYSKHPDNAKQATLELSGINSQFAMYANQYSTNVGSMVKSDGANGLLLYHAGSSAGTAVVDDTNRTQVTIKKAEGVTFAYNNAGGTLNGTYTFPRTSGTNGQVLTKSTGNNIVWTNPSTFGSANNGLTKEAITGTIQLGGTLIKDTEIISDGLNLTFTGTGKLGLGTNDPYSQFANTSTNITDNSGRGVNEQGITWETSGDSYGWALNNSDLTGTGSGLLLKTNSTDELSRPLHIMVGNEDVLLVTGKSNVVIGGTTTPSITVGATTVEPKLHIVGDVSTTGKYYTSSSVYADYVFEKYFKGSSEINPSYEFKSLNYVKKFIEENHHLPGVESINDLNKHEDGYTFDMTKLTVQSLEKIEELYLHTIEQKEVIDAQQKQIDILRKDAEDTKDRLERLEQLLIKKVK